VVYSNHFRTARVDLPPREKAAANEREREWQSGNAASDHAAHPLLFALADHLPPLGRSLLVQREEQLRIDLRPLPAATP